MNNVDPKLVEQIVAATLKVISERTEFANTTVKVEPQQSFSNNIVKVDPKQAFANDTVKVNPKTGFANDILTREDNKPEKKGFSNSVVKRTDQAGFSNNIVHVSEAARKTWTKDEIVAAVTRIVGENEN